MAGDVRSASQWAQESARNPAVGLQVFGHTSSSPWHTWSVTLLPRSTPLTGVAAMGSHLGLRSVRALSVRCPISTWHVSQRHAVWRGTQCAQVGTGSSPKSRFRGQKVFPLESVARALCCCPISTWYVSQRCAEWRGMGQLPFPPETPSTSKEACWGCFPGGGISFFFGLPL